MLTKNDQGVTFGFHTSRATGLLIALLTLPVGGLFAMAFWFGGVLNDWRMVLGWLPVTRAIDQILLVVPLLLLIPLVGYPLWVLVTVSFFGDRVQPQAFFFDNQARRFLISETRITPPKDLADRQGLSGYDYGEIESFGFRTYKTTTTRDTATGHRTRDVTHYVVGFWKTDGHFWDLEDLTSSDEAQALVTRLESEVTLKGDEAPFAPKTPALSHRIFTSSEGDDLILGWKGRVPFGTAVAFLVGAAGLGWFVTLLDRRFHSEGLLVLWLFVVTLAVLGLLLLFSAVKKSFVAHALRFSGTTLEVGTLPVGVLNQHLEVADVEGRFRKKASWGALGVTSVSASFTLEMRKLKTKALVLTGKNQDEKGSLRQQLDISGVTLSQCVDLEHLLEHELKRRGAAVR